MYESVDFHTDGDFVDSVMLFDAGNAVMSIITFFVTLCILISMSSSLHNYDRRYGRLSPNGTAKLGTSRVLG